MRLLVERGAGHQPGQHLLVEAGLARLVIGDGAPRLALQLLQFVLVFSAVLLDADFRVADGRQLPDAKIVEDVANAEEAEADDDQSGEDRQNDAAVDVFRHDPQAVEHGKSFIEAWRRGAEVFSLQGADYRNATARMQLCERIFTAIDPRRMQFTSGFCVKSPHFSP